MDDNEVEIRVTIRDETAAGAAKARAGAKRAGEQAGKEWGTEFTKARDSQVRDSKGRFVSASDPGGAGEESGHRFGAGFVAKMREAFSKGGGGGASGLASKIVGSIAGSFALSAKTLATGFSFQFTGAVAAGLASGAAKMAHGLGAIAALLPAVVATGVLAFGTLKLAVAGVGDALKAGLSGDSAKFQESLKGLAPAARGFAHEIVGMRSQLDGLKNTVQQDFFEEFSGQVQSLGKSYLPALRETMGGVATSFGFAVSNAADFLKMPKSVLEIRSAFGNMDVAVNNVTSGLNGVLAALLPIVAVGASFLPQLTQGFAGATDRLGLFVSKAAETGRLAAWIQGGLDKLQSLWHTGERLWAIFKNVVAIFRMLGGFSGIFDALGLKSGGLLDQLEELTSKAREFFATSKGGKALADTIVTVRELLNAAMGMFAKLAGILAPFLPQIAEFATAVENLLTGIVDAAAPVVEVFLRDLLPVLTDLINLIARNAPIIQGLMIGLFAAWVAGAGAAAIETLIAAAPFIALGLVIAALAAIVIVNFDTIKRWISNVYNWIKDNWPTLVMIMTGPFGLIVALVTGRLNGLIGFVKTLPGKIAAAVAGMWNVLTAGLGNVIDRARQQIQVLLDLWNKIPGHTDVNVDRGKSGFAVYRPPSAHSGVRAMASGGIGGGITELAERGRELMKIPGGGPHGTMVDVPHGSTVYPSGASDRMLAGGGGAGLVLSYEPSGDPLIDAIMDGIRVRVQTRHGGDVQKSLGYTR